MRVKPILTAWLAILLALTLSAAASAEETNAPEVVHFSPQGTVKNVRQVSVRFSEPMVPLGDPRDISDPFEIDCEEAGTARWVDSRNWVYDFERDLPAGLRCAFRLRPRLKSLAGNAISGPQAFRFSTGGPAIHDSLPFSGHPAIEEDQAFVLRLDAEATEASILQHVSFSIEGLPERVGVRLLTGEARDSILETVYPSLREGPLVILQARQSFPNGAKIALHWGKGVATEGGVASEQDQVLRYKVRKAFTARFWCKRERKDAHCNPLAAMTLGFTAPVSWEVARRITLEGPGGKRWTPEEPEGVASIVHGVDFEGPFPESSSFKLTLPESIVDEAGRRLQNADKFPLEIKTEAFPPLAKFSSRFSIVESKSEPALPITLRDVEPELLARSYQPGKAKETRSEEIYRRLLWHLTGKVWRITPERFEEMLPWLRKVARATREESIFSEYDPEITLKAFNIPKPNGAKAFEVVGVPLPGPGLYILEIESPRLGAALLGQKRSMYVPAAALVTNLSVHFKWAHANSLVWVTALDTGRPVSGAWVSVHDCRGTLLWSGRTDGNGVARTDELPERESLPRCPEPAFNTDNALHYRDYEQTPALRNLDEGLFVTARKEDDLTFVHSSWDDGIEPWRFRLPSDLYEGPPVAHTIFDRSLFRAGETVHMKHVLRRRTIAGFAQASPKDLPGRALIRHLGSDETYKLSLDWDKAGITESVWKIPKSAKLGVYQVILERSPVQELIHRFGEAGRWLSSRRDWGQQWRSGEFRVEEFRVPLMKASIRLPAEPQVAVSSVPADLSVRYLAGGGAGKLPVVLRAQISPRGAPSFEGFEGFTFANGAIQEGIQRRGAYDENEEDGAAGSPAIHQRSDLVLDAAGTGRASVTDLPKSDRPQQLLTELEFRDPNGEVQTVSASIPLWPARRLVGIKPDSWMASPKNLKAKAAVIDVSGKPVEGVSVKVELLERRTYSNRKRLVGGFYAYEHIEETVRKGPLCEGTTDSKGLVFCEGKPPAGGNLVLQASVTDEDGNTVAAHAEVWVASSEEWWFRVQDSDRIDLLPEKKSYEPGETARFQVRMPFRKATALVTTEREGILEARVVELSGKDAVVEVPVKEEYAPNMFVSVLAVRGRAGDVQPTAMVDLGRPAFKLGIAEINVGWRAHELKVKVTPDRDVYQVREKVKVKISVRTADGSRPPPGSEVALAAVDEGLLELRPNQSWKLLEAMMGRRNHAVRTATAQMQVIGKRHYGRKALPTGGGGGRQSTRELFDTLLLWKGRVPLTRGEASVEVPLNDSLTSFRIVAVANGAADLFGTGSTAVRTTQDLMILPGVPPVVREGDRFRAEFTARNTTDRDLKVVVQGQVEGLKEPLQPLEAKLSAGEATTLGWEITAPLDVRKLTYQVEARAGEEAEDRVRVSQRVVPAVPVRTYQATLMRLEGKVRRAVERPADSIPGRGGVEVALRPTLVEGMDGVRAWMRDYPYTCLEQRVSRAVALEDEKLWREVSAALPSHLDSDGLLKYFPTCPRGSDVLTAYVLAIAHEAGLSIPEHLRRTMEDGLINFLEGSILRSSDLPAADMPLRKLAAVEALARTGRAEPKFLDSLIIEPNLWPTSAVLDWWSILSRVPKLPRREEHLREAEQIVRARLNLQGTTMGFSTERSDALSWLMVSSDANAVRLILQALAAEAWKEDVPRLLQGALARQRRGAWDLTVANAWGVLAVSKFSKAFEKTPVGGTSTASLAAATRAVDWAESPRGESFSLAWPEAREDLLLAHEGAGQPWLTLQSRAAIPLKAPLSSGYRITKTLTPLEQKKPGRWSRGDVIRVRLEIEAQSDMAWVVLSDPIPAGASVLGTGLARDSQIMTGGESTDWWSHPTFEERSFEAYRAYYEYLPKGTLTAEYTLRLNQSGRFNLPTTRVEALYAPEAFGELPNEPVEVLP